MSQPSVEITALDSVGKKDAWAVGGIAALGIAMFADVFVRGRDTIATSEISDVFAYFGPLRQFAFGEMAQGNFPLWNPHIFSGNPCFGGFQAGLLYPVNAIYLALPLGTAVNLDLWFHVTLLGLTLYAWARNTLLPLPAFYAAAAGMFGPIFLHVMSGHLAMVACMAWTPLLFLSYDKQCGGGGFGWFLLGVLSAAMQVVAGWPQGLLMVTVVFALYWAVTIPAAQRPLRATALMTLTAFAAGLMGAAQLWTGAETSAESVRGAGLPFEFAAGCSLPRENLLTFLMPGIFGNDHQAKYFASNLFWEACAFAGIATLVLAACGAVTAPWKRKRVLLPVLVALLVLALGSYTPLYRILYDWVPGFDRLRAMGRFIMYFSMFAALLAGEGVQALRSGSRRFLPFAGLGLVALAGGLAFAIAVTWLPVATGATLPGWLAWLGDVRAAFIDAWPSEFPETAHQTMFSIYSMIAGAATCTALAVLCLLAWRRDWAVIGLVVFGVLEIALFARMHRGTTQLRHMPGADVAQLYAQDPGDYRVLKRTRWNGPLAARGYSIWGSDALFLDRYAQFIGHTQNLKSRVVDTVIPRLRYRPAFRMLRCKYVMFPEEEKRAPREIADPLPRFLVVHAYQVVPNKEAVFEAMDDSAFDPKRMAVLEQQPVPSPLPAAGGETIRIRSGDTDHTVLEVTLEEPGLLIVTDTYAKSWRVRSVQEIPPQARYDVLPANYTLRAVPLAAGEHRIIMEYAPAGYVYGRWISLAACACFAVACGVWFVRARGKGTGELVVGRQETAALAARSRNSRPPASR